MQLLGTRFCYRNYLLEHYLLGSAATTDQHIEIGTLIFYIVLYCTCSTKLPQLPNSGAGNLAVPRTADFLVVP